MTFVKLPTPEYNANQGALALKLAALAAATLLIIALNAYLYLLKQASSTPFTEHLISNIWVGVKNLIA